MSAQYVQVHVCAMRQTLVGRQCQCRSGSAQQRTYYMMWRARGHATLSSHLPQSFRLAPKTQIKCWQLSVPQVSLLAACAAKA